MKLIPKKYGKPKYIKGLEVVKKKPVVVEKIQKKPKA
jgi:hypothetical protein